MAQPPTRSPAGSGKLDWGDSNWYGAPGTGSPGTDEWKARAEVIAEWMFVEVNGVGPRASFQQEDSQRRTHASAEGIPLEGLIEEWHRH